jgi:hypothetical protein
MSLIKDLFVRVQIGSVSEEGNRDIRTLCFSFDSCTNLEGALKKGQNLAKCHLGITEKILGADAFLSTPLLISWHHTPSLVREWILSDNTGEKFSRAGYDCALDLEHEFVGGIDSAYVVTPSGSAFLARVNSVDTEATRPIEWWRWQFEQFVDIEMRRLGQLSLPIGHTIEIRE